MLFKKQIMITRDLAELNRAREVLEAKQIATFVATNSMTNPGRYHGVPNIQADAAYEYRLYVRSKQSAEAEEILGLS